MWIRHRRFRKQRDIRTYTLFPLLHENKSGEQTKEIHPGAAYLEGSRAILGYIGPSEP